MIPQLRPPPPCVQVLVLDNCMGVVLGAVLERLGGVGAVCCAHVDRPFCTDATRCGVERQRVRDGGIHVLLHGCNQVLTRG